MRRPVVSTLTSCYKAEKFLPLFLEKVPEQTAFDRLQIVIDLNEPSKEELRLVKDFRERYPDNIRYTIQEKVTPYSASWNNCIREAGGDYLAVWNLDDLRTPNSIDAQAKFLDDHPEFGLVHGRYKVVPRFGETEGFYQDRTKDTTEDATRKYVAGPFYMFRRSLLEKAGMVDEQFRSSADFDHCIRMAMHTEFGTVEEDLGYYLMANEGLSTRPDSRAEVENFVIRMRYGIYYGMWYHHLARASEYDYYKIRNGGEWIPVANYVPNYQEMLEERYGMWFEAGLVRHLCFKSKERWFGLGDLIKNRRYKGKLF